jgi:hypothetical protein
MDKRIDQLLSKIAGQMFLGKKLAIAQHVMFIMFILKREIVTEEVGRHQDGAVNSCSVCKATDVQVP